MSFYIFHLVKSLILQSTLNSLTTYFIHPSVTIININHHFKFIQLMMYMIYIINHIYHLI